MSLVGAPRHALASPVRESEERARGYKEARDGASGRRDTNGVRGAEPAPMERDPAGEQW